MLTRKGNTKFTIGYVNDEVFIGTPQELEFGENVAVKNISLKTFENSDTGDRVYEYGEHIGSLKEISDEVIEHTKLS